MHVIDFVVSPVYDIYYFPLENNTIHCIEPRSLRLAGMTAEIFSRESTGNLLYLVLWIISSVIYFLPERQPPKSPGGGLKNRFLFPVFF